MVRCPCDIQSVLSNLSFWRAFDTVSSHSYSLFVACLRVSKLWGIYSATNGRCSELGAVSSAAGGTLVYFVGRGGTDLLGDVEGLITNTLRSNPDV